MKRNLLFLLLLCAVATSYAQAPADTLQFNKRASRSINEWVVFPNGNTNKYPYGFIYVDDMAGFTFQLTGTFTIADNGKYMIDTALQTKLKVGSYKYRLYGNTKLLSAIPKSHCKDLGINGDPDWLKIYNTHTDTLSHNITLARHLNNMNDFESAINYALKTYKIKPHASGLEFELAYAYNASGHYGEAIKVLEPAIKNNANDVFLYKELGYSFTNTNQFEKAIAVFKDGIACSDANTHLNEKAEMAINTAVCYRNLKNNDLFKEWVLKAKEWAPANSVSAKQLVKLGY